MTQQNEAIRLAVEALTNAFLTWKLPESVCADKCASMVGYKYPRSGTNLLSYAEAKAFFEHAVECGLLRPLLDQTSAGVGDGRHQWDRDGERCVKCGDKDWMNDPVCKGRALTQADQQASEKGYPYQDHMDAFEKRLVEPADKDDRREALAAFERVKKFADISTKGVSVFLIDEKKYLNKDLDVIHRALSGSDGRE